MNLKICTFTVFFLSMCFVLNAQTYLVGYKSMDVHDAGRDRDIETTVYYPSDVGGENAAISEGIFPAVIFGHGTGMADESLYDYIYEALVSEGYIVLFPKTEGGMPPLSVPKHEPFGLDLKYLNLMIKFENTNPDAFFNGHVSDKTAIIGHSLGGKGTLIAAANNTDVTTIITLCAALSDPPWPFAGNGYDVVNNSLPYITVPSLVVDTEFDCVVPDDEGHYVTYELLNVDCKTYVNILGGGHCYMASYEGSGMVSCETAENCSDDFTISREEQNNTVIDIIVPYLNYYLKEDATALDDFLDYLGTTSAVTYERDCEMPSPQISQVDVYNQVQDITVPYQTMEATAVSQLVQTISINDTESAEHLVSLNWSVTSYDGNTPADYTATASFSLPTGVEQSDPPVSLVVTATITVENPVNVVNMSFEDIEVFPNPATDVLFYNNNGSNADAYISIYNACGKLEICDKINNNGIIDIKNLKSGLYLVKINKQVKKLIVE
ncbi:MAG: T9SS type A sorting domain-containing protein [Bacteroidales bacterium]|nr:T9SS type A sorting domain-containing protein [Bacteroidales bacterium]